MKIFDPKRHLPLGWEWEQTQDRLIWGHLLSGLSILGFLVRYSYALDALYFYQDGPGGTLIRELDPNRTIAPFRELISGAPLLGMWLFLGMMPLLVWRYYRFHSQGAMAVYTMRRLPNPFEYHRRCWTQPFLSALAELAFYGLLMGLCWLLWRFVTPAACLP